MKNNSTKLKIEHSVFATNLKIIKNCILYVFSVFVWNVIKMQWLPLILNEKSTDYALDCLYEDNYFICIIYYQIHKESDSNI